MHICKNLVKEERTHSIGKSFLSKFWKWPPVTSLHTHWLELSSMAPPSCAGRWGVEPRCFARDEEEESSRSHLTSVLYGLVVMVMLGMVWRREAETEGKHVSGGRILKAEAD